MHDNKNKYTFRKHKAYGLVGAMFATALMVTPGALNHIPVVGDMFESGNVKADWVVDRVERIPQPISETPIYYIGDETRDLGTEYTVTERTAGYKEWRYVHDGLTGATSTQSTVSPGTAGKVAKGTKPTVEKVSIEPTKKQYVKDISRERGAEDIVEKGKLGEKEITTTYSVDYNSGHVTANEPTERVITEAGTTIVKVAAKDKVETIQRGRQTVENQNEIHKTNRTIGFLFYLNEHPNPPITQFQTLLK